MSENEVALYVGLGTVIGSFFGALIISVLGRAQAISTFRQDWINSLRLVFADVLLRSEEFTDVAFKHDEEAYKKKVELVESIYKAKLFLNLREVPSQALVKEIEEIPEKYFGKTGASMEYKKDRGKIENMMQDILKEEWNRVRDGEIKWQIRKRFKAEPLSYQNLVALVVILLAMDVAAIAIMLFLNTSIG